MTAFVWLVDLYARSSKEAQAGTPEEEIRFCSLQIPLQSATVLVFGIGARVRIRFRLGFALPDRSRCAAGNDLGESHTSGKILPTALYHLRGALLSGLWTYCRGLELLLLGYRRRDNHGVESTRTTNAGPSFLSSCNARALAPSTVGSRPNKTLHCWLRSRKINCAVPYLCCSCACRFSA
jgi:hypothetical protein